MYDNILVPVDGGETSTCGLEEAIEIAVNLGSRIRLLHVLNELIFDGVYSPGVYANELFASLRESGRIILAQAEAEVRHHGVEADSVMLESIGAPAADFIVAQATLWPADLIVMGTHGRRGIARAALGSDAEYVVRNASIPVMLVRNTSKRRNSLAERTAAPVAV